jgi:hypothetical protein
LTLQQQNLFFLQAFMTSFLSSGKDTK